MQVAGEGGIRLLGRNWAETAESQVGLATLGSTAATSRERGWRQLGGGSAADGAWLYEVGHTNGGA